MHEHSQIPINEFLFIFIMKKFFGDWWLVCKCGKMNQATVTTLGPRKWVGPQLRVAAWSKNKHNVHFCFFFIIKIELIDGFLSWIQNGHWIFLLKGIFGSFFEQKMLTQYLFLIKTCYIFCHWSFTMKISFDIRYGYVDLVDFHEWVFCWFKFARCNIETWERKKKLIIYTKEVKSF